MTTNSNQISTNQGKQLNIPSHESVTPLRILSNTATQLNGPARTVGGVIIGYMGVSTFQPQPVFKTLENVGGVHTLLGIIAMADDVEYMYAAVKALVCISKANASISRDLDRSNGHQLLAMLYKRKKHLINSHILNLTFSLVITDDSGKEQTLIANVKAFEHLLADLEIWFQAPVEIQRSLHERFNDLLNDKSNAKVFVRLGMLKRVLSMTKVHCLNAVNKKSILTTIRLLITESFLMHEEASGKNQMLTFGQFLVSLLPCEGQNERDIVLDTNDKGERTNFSEIMLHF